MCHLNPRCTVNNDGNLDIVANVAGQVGSQFFNQLVFLKNDGAGHFRSQQTVSVVPSSYSWADANGDGYPDLLVGTYTGPRYFQNDGTGRFAAPVNPTDHNDFSGSVVSTWGDYDGDGFPDFVSGGFNPQTGPELALYRNKGDGTFTNVGSIGTWSQVGQSDLHWADVNSDGRPDFIYTEYSSHIVDVNEGGLLRPATTTDVPVLAQIENTHGAIGWGDYDNNGTLDILQEVSIVNNYGAPPTSRPTAPTNLVATPGVGDTVRLSWDAASDDNTPTAALTYTIRVGTTPGGNEIVSAPALADGTRIVSSSGAFSQTFADVTGLTANTTYYWEVQAVDATYRGSDFVSGSFSFNHPPVILGDASSFTQEDTPLKFVASDFLSQVQDQDAGDSVQSIRIDSLPTSGTLFYQGAAVTIGQEFAVTGAGYDPTDWLVYVPDANVSNAAGPLDQFTFAASDGHDYGNTGNLVVHVNPVTDPPYLTVSDLAGPNSVPFSFPIDAGTADTDGSETVTIDVLGLPANASLSAGSVQSGAWRLTAADLLGLQMTVDTPTGTSFPLTVVVFSKEFGGQPQITSANITITIEVPTITSISVPTTGEEGSQVDLSAVVTDPSGTGLTYTWDINSPNGGFQLTGANVSFTPPDNGPYVATLTVTDGRGATTASPPQHMLIQNVDPVIDSVVNDGPVQEASPVTITVSASDVAGSYDPLFYAFDFDNDGGYETTNPTHVFSTQGTYTVGVLVDDGDGGVARSSTIVILTHTPPTQPSDSDTATNGVVEDAANGTAVGITAASTQVLGLPITYSLTSDAGGRFVIDPNTGVVTVANAALLDFETAMSHTITVQADDGQGGTSTQDFTIAVTNANPSTPTDSDTAANSVVEGSANGTVVGVTASASDPNGPAVTYSLSNDAGGQFAIDANTGIVTVTNAALLDFETAASHTITVQASDGQGGTSTQDFTIAVTNANPSTPTDSDNTANAVLETAAAGTQVGITASSSDPNGPAVVYSLADDAGGRFAIDPTTGIVTVANNALLDFQVAPSHTILVQASDGSGGTSTAAFTISVIDTHGPTVAISPPSSAVTIAGPVTFTVSYTDINFNASTLSAADITLNRTGTANGTVSVSPGTGMTRTVTISNITGDGTLGISITGGTANDTQGNLAAAAGPSDVLSVDRTKPTVTIGTPSQSAANPGDTVTYLVTYTDLNLASVSLTAAKITLNKTGTASGTVSVSGSGNTRIVTISGITGVGTLGISIAADTAVDTVGNSAHAVGPSASFIVRPASKFDMKASVSAPVVEGWNKAWQGTKYNATTGYGWSQSSSVGGGTNGVVPSGEHAAVMGDYAYGVTAATFQVFVGAFQTASVNIYSYGTASQGKPGVAAKIGSGPTSTLTTNGVLTISGTAGADGILSVTFNRATGKAMWIVSAIEVE